MPNRNAKEDRSKPILSAIVVIRKWVVNDKSYLSREKSGEIEHPE